MAKELKELMNEPLENVTVIPDETNTQKWTVEIRGPVRIFAFR
jgi:ubiquitin-protein ligase